MEPVNNKNYLTTEAQRRAIEKYRNSDAHKQSIREYDRAYKTYMYAMSQEFREAKKQKAREYYYKKKEAKAKANEPD
jgi:hypothetical protein